MQDLDPKIKLPTYAKGLSRVRVALAAEKPIPGFVAEDQVWSSRFVAQSIPDTRVTLQDFGYGDFRSTYLRDATAFAGPIKLLTEEGAAHLASICRQLERYATHSRFIISRRLRSADRYSDFIYRMARDRSFLLNASRIAGVPLMPHPISSAAVQVNYYDPVDAGTGRPEQIAKWHVDGMDFVFNMLLSDGSQYEGGDFLYYWGPKAAFEQGISAAQVKKSPSKEVGDTIFVHGSKVYHAVSPVLKGQRISIIFSMFCPYLSSIDSNRFWHVAGDDGVWATLKAWPRFKRPFRSAIGRFRAASCEAIGWDDL